MTRKTKEEQLNFADAFYWKLAHGGKRAYAGRKKQEPTKVVRVPVGVFDDVNALISEYKSKGVTNEEK
tara:strand:- start:1836 stop:2039 length:204 start_codon:yes stop_codon:yes gene_type:complete